MASTRNRVLFAIYLFGLINIVLTRRSFDIVLRSINCTANSKYVSEISCRVDSTKKVPKGFTFMEMSSLVDKFTLAYDLMAFKSNKDRYRVFSVEDIDGCKFLENKIETPIIRIFHEFSTSGGKFPKCPLTKGTVFDFKNVYIDAEKFPAYAPEAKFALSIKALVNKELFYAYDILTEIVPKKKIL